MRRFRDRRDAGKRLGAQLAGVDAQHPVVLGLPRGGVPVAFEVARTLGAPLHVLVVRKLGVPTQPELAMGAIAEGDVVVVDRDVVRAVAVTEREFEAVVTRERLQLLDEVRRLRRGEALPSLVGRVALIVDDGMATGATARAAMRVARIQGASRVVVAAPVMSRNAVAVLRADADEVVCSGSPRAFRGVGSWYEDFTQVSDDEVLRALESAIVWRHDAE